MKKLFLTSILTMCTIAPAMAVPAQPGDIVDDETMCTIEGIGVDDGTALMEAIWTPITYACTAGEYLYIGLDANNNEVAECRTCLENSYCGGAPAGNPYTVENHANDIISCSTLENGAYPSSAAGSSLNTHCYRACNMNNMGTTFANIPHATAVSGNDYYGNGADTCGATACENGWNVKPGVNGPAIAAAIGQVPGESVVYQKFDGTFKEYIINTDTIVTRNADYVQTNYGLSNDETQTFAVNYGNNGVLRGNWLCSTENTTEWTDLRSSVTDQTGQSNATRCWCHINGYTSSDGTVYNFSSLWGHYISSSDCTDSCGFNCAVNQLGAANEFGLSVRAILLDSLGTTLSSCVANTIDINWYNLNNIHATNQCTYNEGITLPEQPSDRTGYTFGGWRIKANTNNNNNSGN